MSVPMQKANATLMPGAILDSESDRTILHVKFDVPHPKRPEIKVEQIIANGTAVRAFAASSLMCTVESNALMVQTGARKLRIKA